MLFDSQLKQFTVPEKYKEELNKMFPKWAAGESLKLVAVPERWKARITVMSENRDAEKFQRKTVKMPPVEGTSHKGRGEFYDEEAQEIREVFYSTNSPRSTGKDGALKLRWPSNTIELYHNFEIKRGQYDLLFFLVYCSKILKGGKNSTRMPMYEIARPQETAAEIIKKTLSTHSVEKFIYGSADADLLKEAISLLSIKGGKTVEENRVAVYDWYKKTTDTNRERLLSLIKFQGDDGVKNTLTKESATDLVNKHMDAGILKLEDGKWMFENQKTKKFSKIFETSKEGVDATFELIDLIEKDKTLQDKLK